MRKIYFRHPGASGGVGFLMRPCVEQDDVTSVVVDLILHLVSPHLSRQARTKEPRGQDEGTTED